MILIQNNDNQKRQGRREKTPRKGGEYKQHQTQWSKGGPNTSGDRDNISCCIGGYRSYMLLPEWGPIPRNGTTPFTALCKGTVWAATGGDM